MYITEFYSRGHDGCVADVKCKKSRGEDNPFSFKKFLQTGESDGDTGPGRHIVTLDLANDLPDFVHHRQSVSTDQPMRTARSDCQLPDFTLDLQARSSCHERLSLNNASQSGSWRDRHCPDDGTVVSMNSNEERASSKRCQTVDTSQSDVHLPDFTRGLGTVRSTCDTLTGDPHNHPPELHLSNSALKLPDSCIGIVDNDIDGSTPAGEDSHCMHEHCLDDLPGVVTGQSGLSLPDFLLGYPGSLTTAEQKTVTNGDHLIVETNGTAKSEHIQVCCSYLHKHSC